MVKEFEIAEIVNNRKTVGLTVNFATVEEIGERISKIDFFNSEKTGAKPVIEHDLAQTLNPNKQTLAEIAANKPSPEQVTQNAELAAIFADSGIEKGSDIKNVVQRTGGKGAYIG